MSTHVHNGPCPQCIEEDIFPANPIRWSGLCPAHYHRAVWFGKLVPSVSEPQAVLSSDDPLFERELQESLARWAA